MKWVLYNFLFALAFPLLLPGFLLRMARRGGYRARMLDRFAVYPAGLFRRDGSPYVWIHAVSVGEVQVAGQLMREWRKIEPSVRFCFSTTSSTGWKMAEREIADGDVLIYNPLDFPNFVKSAFASVRPRALVLAESEIWPNFILRARKLGIPVFLANARVSDRSAPRYAKAKFFFADIFRSFSRIYAQSALDKSRLVAAGAPEETVSVDGSFKFDVARRNPDKEKELSEWIAPVLAGEGRPRPKIILGGSTWPGEDEVLLSIAGRLGGTLLIIAPRHFEKADAVEANIVRAGFKCVRRSRVEKPQGGGGEVLLADTTGELMGLYALADVVFVGKSLCEHGSQNMIEPCLCGKSVLVGPYTENFRPVMSDLLDARAVLQVKDAAELGARIADIVASGDGGLGERAREAVLRRQGVTPRCAREMSSIAAGSRMAEKPHGGGPVAKTIVLSVLCACAAAAGLLCAVKFRAGASVASAAGAEAPARQTLPMHKPVKTITAFIPLAEKPDAATVLLCGDAAGAYRKSFEAAGLATDAEAADTNRFDIVFAAGARSAEELAEFSRNAACAGVLAWAVNVEHMTAGDFKRALETFPGDEVHLWMPTERDWVLASRMDAGKVDMSALMELFSTDPFLTTEAEEAGAGAIQELLANYVGTREDVMPALEAGDMSVKMRPEFVIPEEVPDIAWISPDGTDPDIVQNVAGLIVSKQDTRRKIVAADMKFRNEGLVDDAIAMWSEAMRENPHDTMLLDRLYVIAVNARAFKNVGNFANAARCYEAMVSIRPWDIPVVEEYANILRALGKTGMADKIRSRAGEMRIENRIRDVERENGER